MNGVLWRWCFVMMMNGVFCGEGDDSDDGNGDAKLLQGVFFFLM